MFTVTVDEKNGKSQTLQFDKNEVTLGRTQQNDIVLARSNISKQHARIVCNNGSYVVIDSRSTNGTYVNGKRINAPYDLADNESIYVGDFTISIKREPSDAPAPVAAATPGNVAPNQEWSGDADARAPFEDDWAHADDDAAELQAPTETALPVDDALGLTAQGDRLPPRISSEKTPAPAAAPTEARDMPGVALLTQLLRDETLTNIVADGPGRIYVERNGKLERFEQAFTDAQDMTDAIRQATARLNGGRDKKAATIDVRFENGTRLHALLPPWSVDGPSLAIRKRSHEPPQVDELVARQTLTAAMTIFLETCVVARKNILVAGGSDSGKTTTLNGLANFIPAQQRIVTVEQAFELELDRSDVIRLQAHPRGTATTEISLRDLLHSALALRPERIVLDECHGNETLALLQALNAGYDGSLATLQAQSIADALSRLEAMARAADGGTGSAQELRQLIANTVHIIIYQRRFADGVRRIAAIAEVMGVEGERVVTRDLFVFEHKGLDAQGRLVGRFRPTGVVPRFFDDLHDLGIEADSTIFNA